MFGPETNHFSLLESHTEMDERSRHAVAYVERPSPQTDLMFMFGGESGPPVSYLNDLWVMDTNAQGQKGETFIFQSSQTSTEESSESSNESTSNSSQTSTDDSNIDQSSTTTESAPIGVIIGVVVAVLLVLNIFGILAVIIFIKRKKKNNKIDNPVNIEMQWVSTQSRGLSCLEFCTYL